MVRYIALRHMGEAAGSVSQEADGARGKGGQEPILWFPWKGMGETG